jgi:hypothetical protein
VFGADSALGLGGRHFRQRRLQGCAVQCGARPEVGGLVQAPRGVGARNPQPALQHGLPRLHTQLDRGGFTLQTGDDPVSDGRCSPRHGFHLVEDVQEFGRGQGVEGHLGQRVDGRQETVDRRGDLLAIVDGTRTHASKH